MATSAADYLPRTRTLPALRRAVQGCRGCPLYRDATRAVFGEGPIGTRLFLIGEQPGDREDLAGHPFVGPAGRILHRALADAGIERAETYLTNAVKHFKFVRRGERRLHAKPGTTEVNACFPWLLTELEAVKPALIVGLGATAARAMMGRAVPIGANRGRVLESPLGPAMITVHPSFLLRIPDPAGRKKELARFVADLRAADLASRSRSNRTGSRRFG